MAYFDGAADLEHLRDSGFVERFLKVLKKLGLLVNNRHTNNQTNINGAYGAPVNGRDCLPVWPESGHSFAP